MQGPILSLKGVTRSFGSGDAMVRAVDNVDIEIGNREALGIVGESGCGKSTLARIALKLLDVQSGRIELHGRDVTHLSERRMRPLRSSIQAVFQDPMSSLNPRMTVRRIIAEPLQYSRLSRAEVNARVIEMLNVVGLPSDAADRYPHAFSGGQRQRITLARALAAKPQLIICDEATSALDVSVQAQILNLLSDLQSRFGVSYMFISHNLGAVRHLCQRVAVMYLGRVVELGSGDEVFDRPAHPYTAALLAAVPEAVLDEPAPLVLKGEVASALERPSGCHFYPRCPRAQDRCKVESPQLTPLPGRQSVRCHFPL